MKRFLQMKRLSTVLFVILLSAVGLGKMYAQNFTIGDLNYSVNIDGATVTVTGHMDGSTASGTLDIPESVSYNGISYTVTAIGNTAFSDCFGLTGDLTIPNCVTFIGSSAFKGCRGFNGHLTLSDNVTVIGDEAFSGCINLTGNLTIPNSLTTIHSSVFASCFGFSSLTIPNSVTTIKRGAFSQCTGITELVIPSSVTTIEVAAFNGCESLTSITIPSSLTTITGNAFSDCYNMGIIMVDSGNPVYDSRNNCNGIIETATNTLITGCKSTIIPNTVTSIGKSAFSGCNDLLSIEIPNSVISIGEDAFNHCTGLLSINIPNSVTEIDTNPFSSCDGLKQIVVETGNAVFDSRGNCNAIIVSDANELIVGCKNTYIPNSVTSIGKKAFYACHDLTCITIPESVTSIRPLAFAFTSGLDTVIALSTTPPNISSGSFYFPSIIEQLIVSCGSQENYEASDWANYFSSIMEDCNTYNVRIDEGISGGNVNASVGLANLGEEVQLTITPDNGMMLRSLTVSDVSNPSQTVLAYPINGNSVYGFTMPPYDVMVSAVFVINNTVDEGNDIVMSVYPNPTNGQIKIEVEGLKHITISNILGQTIYEGNANGDTFEYNFGKHDSGLYLIKIETANGMATKKISVVR